MITHDETNDISRVIIIINSCQLIIVFSIFTA